MIRNAVEVLGHANSAFDVGGARMTLTSAELLSRLQTVYPDTYGSWSPQQLDNILGSHWFEHGLMRRQLPGLDRFGYWHEDIIRAHRTVPERVRG